MALIERPYKFSFSKNDIRYVFQLANPDRPGLYLQVKLLYADMGSSVFNELYTFSLKPDSNGMVYVYVQDYIDSVLKLALPGINQVVTPADQQATQFYIEFRELTDDIPDPNWLAYELKNIRIAIKGGVEKNKFSRNNVFINYIETQTPFLTWAPKHFVFYDEKVYLSFFNKDLNNHNLLLYIETKDIAGNSGLLPINFTGNNLIYHFDISPAMHNLIATVSDKLLYFQVYIVDQSNAGAYLSNIYRYYIEHRPAYTFYDLIYFNSLSGIDSVRVFGETSLGINRDTDETEGGLKLDWANPVNNFEKAFTNIQLQRQYKGDIGYLRNRTKKEQESFIDILAAEKIYQLIDSRWIPVLGLQKTVALGTNKDTRQSFPIEWSLSEKNEVYTPNAKNFGAGTDTENYTVSLSAPTNLRVDHITAQDSSQSLVYLNWDVPADSDTGMFELHVQVVGGSSTDEDVGPPIISRVFFFGSDGRTEKFKVRIKDNDGNYSPYSNELTVTLP